MMDFTEETLYFINMVKDLYFCKRDMGALRNYLSEDITWLGTGEDEICRNLEEACTALDEEFQEYEDSFSIEDETFYAQQISDEICLVYGKLHAIPKNPELSDIPLHISIIVRKSEEGMKLVHCDFSRPDDQLQENHFYVFNEQHLESTVLQNELKTQQQKLATLMSNIPGGVHQCADDEKLTLLGVNDGFLKLVGYTREEIQKEFNNEFLQMIYEEDREHVIHTMINQIEKEETIELEYRVLCKDHNPIWILDKGKLCHDGKLQCYYCVLIEITDRKKQQEELRLSLERHELIMEQTTDIIFEWDVVSDSLMLSNNWNKRFHYPPIYKNAMKCLKEAHLIHEEDKLMFNNIMKDVLEGAPFVELECRISDANGKDIWCRIRASTQFDEYQRPVKAIGVIVDVTDEKIEKEDLRKQAQRDSLTSLYNRTTLKALTEQRMREKNHDGLQAIMIFDVDAFKQINDEFGHLSGDAVLREVAHILTSSFRSKDVIGRIGGDEFMVYIADIKDKETLQARAKTILAKFHNMHFENGIEHIGCSIGAVMFSHKEDDYFGLYEKADQALYFQKDHGKDGISIYEESMKNRHYHRSNVPDFQEALSMNEIAIVDEELMQFIFRTLYRAHDIKKAIHQMLEFVGKFYDVSRTYIFENTDEQLAGANTFEWCAEGITPVIKNIKNQKFKDMGNYVDNFNERGIFYCHDIHDVCKEQRSILARHGIYSMLQIAMFDNGEIVGWVGFDDCRRNRNWTGVQANTLSLIGNVIAVFLQKERLEEKLRSK